MQQGRFEEKVARFYAAQIFLGIQYIHSKQIHYELNFEDLLLDYNGNIVIDH
jgi:protein kinase A